MQYFRIPAKKIIKKTESLQNKSLNIFKNKNNGLYKLKTMMNPLDSTLRIHS